MYAFMSTLFNIQRTQTYHNNGAVWCPSPLIRPSFSSNMFNNSDQSGGSPKRAPSPSALLPPSKKAPNPFLPFVPPKPKRTVTLSASQYQKDFDLVKQIAAGRDKFITEKNNPSFIYHKPHAAADWTSLLSQAVTISNIDVVRFVETAEAISWMDLKGDKAQLEDVSSWDVAIALGLDAIEFAAFSPEWFLVGANVAVVYDHIPKSVLWEQRDAAKFRAGWAAKLSKLESIPEHRARDCDNASACWFWHQVFEREEPSSGPFLNCGELERELERWSSDFRDDYIIYSIDIPTGDDTQSSNVRKASHVRHLIIWARKHFPDALKNIQSQWNHMYRLGRVKFPPITDMWIRWDIDDKWYTKRFRTKMEELGVFPDTLWAYNM